MFAIETLQGLQDAYNNGASATVVAGSPVTFVLPAIGGPTSPFGDAALSLENPTPATVGVQVQQSPALEFIAHVWNGADAISRWEVYAAPNVGTAGSDLVFYATKPDGSDIVEQLRWTLQATPGGSLVSNPGLTSPANWTLRSPAGVCMVSLDDGLAFGSALIAASTALSATPNLVAALINPVQNTTAAAAYVQNSAGVPSAAGKGMLDLLLSGGSIGSRYAMISAANQPELADGLVSITCSGTVAAGQVVVWAGTKKVATAAATNNLTTIAGVALTGATNGAIIVATAKLCYVNADAGITAGQLVGTSNATAGNVQSGTAPGAGAIVGRAVEASGATVAGKVLAYLILG